MIWHGRCRIMWYHMMCDVSWLSYPMSCHVGQFTDMLTRNGMLQELWNIVRLQGMSGSVEETVTVTSTGIRGVCQGTTVLAVSDRCHMFVSFVVRTTTDWWIPRLCWFQMCRNWRHISSVWVVLRGFSSFTMDQAICARITFCFEANVKLVVSVLTNNIRNFDKRHLICIL